MIEERSGDIFAQPDVNVVAHQANIFHTLAKKTSSGIARVIENRFDCASEADGVTKYGDLTKVGTYSSAKDEDSGLTIVNCYSQTGMKSDDRNTDYNAILIIFKALEAKISAWNDKNADKTPKVIAVPYGYGSNIAGGYWTIVRAVFEAVFKNSTVKLVIVRLPTQGDLE